VLLNGKPLASYALDAFLASGAIDEVVVVVAPADVERARRVFLADAGAVRHAVTVKIAAGGDQRQVSVRAGLDEVNPGCDFVLVHDAARPFLRADLIRRCLEGAVKHGAVVAAAPTTDTVKEVDPEGAVIGTLDRSRLWLVQTPQVFRYQLLVEAHRLAAETSFSGTDDAALVEQMGHRVHVVLGDADNIKITWHEDLRRAERYLCNWKDKAGREMAFRSGIGYDAHVFQEGRPLVLAGVRFPGEKGLAGHSDADVVCHAICDALLGAAGAGDIGGHFPDTDPRYSGVSSLSLLARTSEMVKSAGWNIENVDAVVVAEAPRIAPKVEGMRRALAEAMGIGVERVSLKGKTTEGMGFTGRQEGIASQAIALLRTGTAQRPDNEEKEC
jgi:2-C-methyl-D-erythritol 4-phosphate cytidylyltransferase/2-C-methyl-D-erythritol 2,4-cyclodiphosphate synthase